MAWLADLSTTLVFKLLTEALDGATKLACFLVFTIRYFKEETVSNITLKISFKSAIV